MTAVGYPYASGDLLEDRQTYFYSEYAGRPFLDAWRHQRDGLLSELPKAMGPSAGKEGAQPPQGDVIETSALLDYLFSSIVNGRAEEAGVREWLSRLVKKFEVTKRIHHAYGPSFRALDPADHKNPVAYLRLAEIFEAAYAATGELIYVNALLKCMDTLSTLAEQLPENDRARLAGLIEHERAHIESLADMLKETA